MSQGQLISFIAPVLLLTSALFSMHAYKHAYKHAGRMHTHGCAYTYTHTYMHAHTYTHTHTHTHTHTNKNTHCVELMVCGRRSCLHVCRRKVRVGFVTLKWQSSPWARTKTLQYSQLKKLKCERRPRSLLREGKCNSKYWRFEEGGTDLIKLTNVHREIN